MRSRSKRMKRNQCKQMTTMFLIFKTRHWGPISVILLRVKMREKKSQSQTLTSLFQKKILDLTLIHQEK